jgi:hypothetical protein
MRVYTKLVILVVVFVALLGTVWTIQQKNKRGEREIVAAQKAAFFPGVEADKVFRIEVNSLQDGSLLLRKQAGVWEVSKGRDIIAELMSQAEDEEKPESGEDEAITENAEEDEEAPPEETEAPEAEKKPEEPADPSKDPGPIGENSSKPTPTRLKRWSTRL